MNNNTLFIIPKSCKNCGNGFYALFHVVNEIKERRPELNVIVLADDDAVKNKVVDAINQFDPYIVISFGHGSPFEMRGDDERVIFSIDNVEILNGRIWHTLSCSVGKYLGPFMVATGGGVFFGYDEDWYWVAEDVNIDAYDDPYARAFFESNNVCSLNILLDNVENAWNEGIRKYNEWIDYWLRSEDKYAVEVAKWLIWDRDNFVYIPTAVIPSYEISPIIPILLMGVPAFVGAIAAFKSTQK